MASFTILLADDDPDDVLLASLALRQVESDAAVVTVQDGEELLDYLFKREAFDQRGPGGALPNLILLDLNMPRLSGLEALQRLRADPALRALPVVVLSGSESPEDLEQSYAFGANAYITKPNSLRAMVEALEGVLAVWRNVGRAPGATPAASDARSAASDARSAA